MNRIKKSEVTAALKTLRNFRERGEEAWSRLSTLEALTILVLLHVEPMLVVDHLCDRCKYQEWQAIVKTNMKVTATNEELWRITCRLEKTDKPPFYIQQYERLVTPRNIMTDTDSLVHITECPCFVEKESE